MSVPDTRHCIADANPDTMLGTCSQCGPGVRIYIHKKRVRCVKRVRASNSSSSKRPHGLTPNEARAYLEGKSCRVCGTKDNLVVDHCHNSMRIRGALCRNHNVGLGMFDDRIDHLRSAEDYLLEEVDVLAMLGYSG